MKRKLIDIALIIMWMITIFYFSNQPADISGKTSGTIAKDILQKTNIIDTIPTEKQEDVISHFDNIIRKIAHYTIYTIGGILVFNFVRKIDMSEKKKIIYSFLFGMCYAITDEIHQYFIAGRACMWQDVCLDSLGVLTGIVVMLMVVIIMSKMKEGKVNE